MKKIIYRLLYILLVGLSVGFTSCGEDEVAENEWNATYVYIQREDYLEINNSVFNLSHSMKGIEGDVSFTFKMKTQKPAEQDIVGNLIFTGTEEFPVSLFTLSTDKPVIKAGTTESEEITLTLTGKEELVKNEGMLSGEFDIKLTNLQTNNWHTMISTNSTLTALHFTVNKAEFSVQNLEMGEVESESTYLLDRSVWTLKAEQGIENDVKNIIDGSRSTDIAMDNAGFWITIDLAEPQEVTGICTYHWGISYAPMKIEVFTSDDGVAWKTMGQLKVSGETHKVKLINPVVTRYLKYDMLEVPSRVDITEFYVYASKK